MLTLAAYTELLFVHLLVTLCQGNASGMLECVA